MSRPLPHKSFSPLTTEDKNYITNLEQYCDLLEQTISALRDDYAELKQNYTDCVNSNTVLQKGAKNVL